MSRLILDHLALGSVLYMNTRKLIENYKRPYKIDGRL